MTMVGVAGGEIRLKSEGTHSSWVEVVGPYEIAARPTPVGLYSQLTEEVDAAMQESNLAVTASCRRKSHPSLKVDDLGFRIARTVV